MSTWNGASFYISSQVYLKFLYLLLKISTLITAIATKVYYIIGVWVIIINLTFKNNHAEDDINN